VSAPDGGSSVMKELNIPTDLLEQYFEINEETPNAGRPSDTTKHQMFGFSRPVQNEMELECDAIRRGEQMRWDAPNQRFAAAVRDWILLLQLDTDDYKDGPGWMW